METYKPLEDIAARFSTIKLPQKLKQMVLEDITRWYHCNGETEVVKRLKFIRQVCVKYLAEGALPPKDAEVWIRRNNSGLLYGHWGSLMKLMKSEPQEVLTMLSCYTVFVQQTGPTEKQIQSFQQAIEKPFTGDSVKLASLENKLVKKSKHILKRYLGRKHKLLVTDVKEPTNYVLNGRFRNDSHKRNVIVDLIDCLNDFAFVQLVSMIPWIDNVFGIKLFNGLQQMNMLFEPNRFPMSIGNINWIMEPGMKERIVTDFRKPLEHLTLPLGKRLYEIVEQLPWDATFHEEMGYNLIREALKQGKMCFCFDLSKATDRFPYSLQQAVLKSLDLGPNYNMMLELLTHAVTGVATLPNGVKTKWSVGQPMGAYPSFAMFTLTHGMILMEYLYSRGIEYRGQFVVHGDDLVIMDEELAKYYLEFTELAGIDVNQFKTIVSNTVAEFNSRLIRANDTLFMRKWRPVTFENIADQILVWGPKAINWLRCGQRLKDDIMYLLSLPGVLPSGESINPKGISLKERLSSAPEGLLEFITTKNSNLCNFVSYRELALTRLRNNSFCVTDSSDMSTYCKFEFNEQATASYVLQVHLGCLDIADTLDREILEECHSFTEFFSFDKSNVNPLVRQDDIGTFHLAATLFPNVGHMLRAFNDVWHLNEDVSFNFIRQEETRRRYNKVISTSRINKLIKVMRKCRRNEQATLSLQNQQA